MGSLLLSLVPIYAMQAHQITGTLQYSTLEREVVLFLDF